MHNQKNYNIYSFEAEEEKTRRLKNSIVSQLTSFTFNMLSFELEPRDVREILINFGKYFELTDDKIEELLKNLEEYIQINISKSNQDNSETNDEAIAKVDNEVESNSDEITKEDN